MNDVCILYKVKNHQCNTPTDLVVIIIDLFTNYLQLVLIYSILFP